MVLVPETAPDLVWGYKGEPGSAGAAFDGSQANITRGKLIGGTGGRKNIFSRQNPPDMERRLSDCAVFRSLHEVVFAYLSSFKGTVA
jgi:hypothetical protein